MWATYLFVSIACCLLWHICGTFHAWHRLRHIPAPSWYATVSYLWLAKTTWSGRQYWIHRELHRKHGPLVRVGPNEIITDDPEIAKHVSSPRSGYTRSSFYQSGRTNPYHDNLLSILDSEAHRKAKARSAPAYSGRTTGGLERGVDEQLITLMHVLHKRCVVAASSAVTDQKPLLDLEKVTCYFTMDVITRLAFGKAVGYLRDDIDHYGFFNTVRALWPWMSTSAVVPWLREIVFSPLALRLFGPKPTDTRGFGALMGVAERLINDRYASREHGGQPGMLDSFMGNGFTEVECQVEGLLVLFAGTESTACAIRSAILHVITAPPVYARLKEEVRSAIADGKVVSRPISMQEAVALPYLQAIVYESIRMRPPLLGFWPKIVPAGGAIFHGQTIPAGTSVGVNHSSLLRSETLFSKDADIFRPERFLEVEACARQEMERAVELAFGYGPWVCAGKSVAFMEMKKFLFEVFRTFNLQVTAPFTPRQVESYGVFLEPGLLCDISLDL